MLTKVVKREERIGTVLGREIEMDRSYRFKHAAKKMHGKNPTD
ncbi:hypothetical protein [Exiguobacterium sp. s192]|nr:hypothetical protein [Exiguobacterium sp. s192]